MTDTPDAPGDEPGDRATAPTDDPDPRSTPTVSCQRCGREWDLEYELDDLRAGNRAVEQFALDHRRHTGHFPDGVTPFVVDCQHCPDDEQFLAERPAQRWANTHARHTGHTVEIRKDGDGTVVESAASDNA